MSITDMGKLEQKIEYQLNRKVMGAGGKTTVKEKYGKTTEFSYYGHGGTDGPKSMTEASGNYNLGDQTSNADDRNQLTLEGWANIDFNFAYVSIANFYGCRMADFARKFSVIQNVKYASGYNEQSGPSSNPTEFSSKWFSGEYMYLCDGVGLDVFEHKDPPMKRGSEDNDHDGYLDMEVSNPTDPVFWVENPFFNMPISSGNYTVNIWTTSD